VHYKDQILAYDFFTVETVWLKTIYVLFFIELGTLRTYLAGYMINPDITWATQQARTMGMSEDYIVHFRREALLHDMGKLGVPDDILFNPAALTEEEWAIIK
jgi:response regulator RpfG family c-di-GMP phosphodiesterase